VLILGNDSVPSLLLEKADPSVAILTPWSSLNTLILQTSIISFNVSIVHCVVHLWLSWLCQWWSAVVRLEPGIFTYPIWIFYSWTKLILTIILHDWHWLRGPHSWHCFTKFHFKVKYTLLSQWFLPPSNLRRVSTTATTECYRWGKFWCFVERACYSISTNRHSPSWCI
jgi:hypothetical protein